MCWAGFCPAAAPRWRWPATNHIAIGSFLFFGVTFVLAGVVRSTGAVMAPVLILAIAMWGIRVPWHAGCNP
jgi:Na+-driven multidrug efflux pump